jgi:hypothetical protein
MFHVHEWERAPPHNIEDLPFMYRWKCTLCEKEQLRGYNWEPSDRCYKINALIKAHNYFFKVSKSYVDDDFIYYTRLPIAYCHFMWTFGRNLYKGKKLQW